MDRTRGLVVLTATVACGTAGTYGLLVVTGGQTFLVLSGVGVAVQALVAINLPTCLANWTACVALSDQFAEAIAVLPDERKVLIPFGDAHLDEWMQETVDDAILTVTAAIAFLGILILQQVPAHSVFPPLLLRLRPDWFGVALQVAAGFVQLMVLSEQVRLRVPLYRARRYLTRIAKGNLVGFPIAKRRGGGDGT